MSSVFKNPAGILRRLGTRFLLFTFTFLLFPGCAGYKLGKDAGTPFSTLRIAPIVNDTQAAQVQAILSEQLANSLQQEKSVRVVNDGGQATLHVRLVEYKSDVSATLSDDTVRGSVYGVRIRARCTLTDNISGKNYFRDREINASANIPAGNSFSAAEYQTIPILTRELARRIKDAVVGTW